MAVNDLQSHLSSIECVICGAAAAMDELKQSVALDSVTDEFDAYYLPGGHGTAGAFSSARPPPVILRS